MTAPTMGGKELGAGVDYQHPTPQPQSTSASAAAAHALHQGRSFFRSAPMTLLQLYIPTESIQSVVAEIGELGCVQFRDLQPEVTAFQRTFTSEIRKLDEMEQKVRILLDQAAKEEVPVRSWITTSPASGTTPGNGMGQPSTSLVSMRGKALYELEELEPELDESVNRILQLDANQQEIARQYLRMLEWHSVLVALAPYLTASGGGRLDYSSDRVGGQRGMMITPSTAVPDLAGATSTLSFAAAADALTVPGTISEFDTNNGGGGIPIDTDTSELAHLASADRDIHSMTEEGGIEAVKEAAETTFVAGAIIKKKLAAFERVLWRALRGNVYIRSADCVVKEGATIAASAAYVTTTTTAGSNSNTETSALEPKSAFVAYVHGRETLGRLKRICEALGCKLYDVHPDAHRRHDQIEELTSKLDDMYAVLFNTRQAKRAALSRLSESLERWLLLVRKKKCIFDTMNKFGCDADPSTRKYYIAEGWCPTCSLVDLEVAIRTASERAGVQVAPVLTTLDRNGSTLANLIPPTYFPTNKFTSTFQDMTDSYGVATYEEANPSLFMIISFPFLFAVMFGDVGHGLMMALFAIWMVLDERRLQSGRLDEIFEMIFGGRYILLLMGLFSIFTGLLYNDIFSRALTIFPSMWNFPTSGGEEFSAVRRSPSYTYPFGIDPAWSLSGNAMLFLNSYKMKLAIILGVTQMLFGLAISGTNYVYGRKPRWIDVWCTLVPQVLFMSSIFGYLVWLVLYKWWSGWDVSILNTLIGMIMKFGAVDGTPIYTGQALVQHILIVTALICIPWMFLGKPFYLIWQRRQQQRGMNNGGGITSNVAYQPALDTSDSTEGTAASISSTTKKASADDDEHEMGEVWVHQLIHTIEFVLGSVSNTASYLRLWALSLAHAQLSDVLWQMTIEKVVTKPMLLFPVFLLWLAFTVAIMVAMEGMSAFLHALRLHWVEFNNKFYTGGGVKFEPFSLANDRQFLAAAVTRGGDLITSSGPLGGTSNNNNNNNSGGITASSK